MHAYTHERTGEEESGRDGYILPAISMHAYTHERTGEEESGRDGHKHFLQPYSCVHTLMDTEFIHNRASLSYLAKAAFPYDLEQIKVSNLGSRLLRGA